MFQLHFLLQSGSNPLLTMWPMLLIIVVFYFFMIRPQAQKQKHQTKFTEDIAKGDDVVTASGIIGKVTKIEDNIVTLQIDTKSFLRVTRNAISKEMTEAVYAANNDSK